MSETSSGVTNCHDMKLEDIPDDAVFADVGPPYPGVSMKVVGENGEDLPDPLVGSLLVKGPTVFRQYYKNPTATQSSFTEDGWFITGDLAFMQVCSSSSD